MRMLPLILAVTLSACAGGVRQHERAVFDLGPTAIVWQTEALPLQRVEVAAPSWLATSAIHYRLLYADAGRRLAYTESRWAAPSAELVERALNRQPSAMAGCRLRLDIDEWIQAFDSPQRSRVVVELRATLLPARGDAVLARKAFAAEQAAPSADARGGVAAGAAALRVAAGEIGGWLAQEARATPDLARRCTNAPAPALPPRR